MAVGYFEEKTSFSFSLFSPYSGKFVQYIVLVSQEVQIFKCTCVVLYYAPGYIQYIHSNQLINKKYIHANKRKKKTFI